MHLKERLSEKWIWEVKIKGKSQGLFVANRSFEHILIFSVVFDCLEPLKPLVTKLKK